MAAETRRFGLFLVAGGIAALANYGSRFGFSVWFSYPVAIVLAYLVGMAVAFALMRQYVFDGRGKAIGPQALRFVGVNVLAVLQTLSSVCCWRAGCCRRQASSSMPRRLRMPSASPCRW